MSKSGVSNSSVSFLYPRWHIDGLYTSSTGCIHFKLLTSFCLSFCLVCISVLTAAFTTFLWVTYSVAASQSHSHIRYLTLL